MATLTVVRVKPSCCCTNRHLMYHTRRCPQLCCVQRCCVWPWERSVSESAASVLPLGGRAFVAMKCLSLSTHFSTTEYVQVFMNHPVVATHHAIRAHIYIYILSATVKLSLPYIVAGLAATSWLIRSPCLYVCKRRHAANCSPPTTLPYSYITPYRAASACRHSRSKNPFWKHPRSQRRPCYHTIPIPITQRALSRGRCHTVVSMR